MLSTILLIAIVVLLVIVLLPVGIAAVRRIRTRDSSSPVPQKKERASVPPLETPPPSSRHPSDPATTSPIKLAEQLASGPMKTTAMQWYGMLVCTGGPLEGQAFPIEEDGFYIGREPATGVVVVNDSRVSKRHVRIVPRNGKVFAVDHNSTNGTFLKSAPGQRLTEVQLERGDEIIIADHAAIFRYQI